MPTRASFPAYLGHQGVRADRRLAGRLGRRRPRQPGPRPRMPKVTLRQSGHHREVIPALRSSAKSQCGAPPTASIPKPATNRGGQLETFPALWKQGLDRDIASVTYPGLTCGLIRVGQGRPQWAAEPRLRRRRTRKRVRGNPPRVQIPPPPPADKAKTPVLPHRIGERADAARPYNRSPGGYRSVGRASSQRRRARAGLPGARRTDPRPPWSSESPATPTGFGETVHG